MLRLYENSCYLRTAVYPAACNLNICSWTDCPFKACKSTFNLEELWLLSNSSIQGLQKCSYQEKKKKVLFSRQNLQIIVLKPYFSTQNTILLPLLSHPNLSHAHTHFEKRLQTLSASYKSCDHIIFRSASLQCVRDTDISVFGPLGNAVLSQFPIYLSIGTLTGDLA